MPGEVEVTRKLLELLDEGKTGTIVGALVAVVVLGMSYDTRPVDPISHQPVEIFETHIAQYKVLGVWTTELPMVFLWCVVVLLVGAVIGLGIQNILLSKKSEAA